MNSTQGSLMMCFITLMGVIMFLFLDYMEVVMSTEPSEEAKALLAEADAAYHSPDAVAARERIAERAARQLEEGTLDDAPLPPGWKE